MWDRQDGRKGGGGVDRTVLRTYKIVYVLVHYQGQG